MQTLRITVAKHHYLKLPFSDTLMKGDVAITSILRLGHNPGLEVDGQRARNTSDEQEKRKERRRTVSTSPKRSLSGSNGHRNSMARTDPERTGTSTTALKGRSCCRCHRHLRFSSRHALRGEGVMALKDSSTSRQYTACPHWTSHSVHQESR